MAIERPADPAPVAHEGSAPIARSPADVLRLVVAAVLLLVVIVMELVVGDNLVAFASDLLRGLDAVPDRVVDAVVVATRMLAAVVLVGALYWAIRGREWRALAMAAGGSALAVALFALLAALVDTDTGRDLVDVAGPWVLSTDGTLSTSIVAAIAGGLTAVAPWTGRRWRKLAWTLLLGLALVTFLQAPVSFDTALAIVSGWLAGAGLLVAVGAPSRRPTVDAVQAGLRAVGLPVAQLSRASVDARGSTPYFGATDDGEGLFVKVLGDDERSADLLFRLYRALQPHDLGDERPFGSLRRGVEHEAFVAHTVVALGIRTPALRAFATAEPNGYVLAYDAIAGTSIDRVAPANVSDDLLAAVWDLVTQLRRHRIAHRDLRLANLFLDDTGQAWIIDFGFSEVAASDPLLAADVAELIASSSAKVGPERAVAHAVRAVDRTGLAQALDRLHRWSLSGATRTAVSAQVGLLDDLRARLATAARSPERS